MVTDLKATDPDLVKSLLDVKKDSPSGPASLKSSSNFFSMVLVCYWFRGELVGGANGSGENSNVIFEHSWVINACEVRHVDIEQFKLFLKVDQQVVTALALSL
ncbi:hypothetical protein TNCV_3555621 [Trichonephila clavipes]|nr:hypothetical protein TNCV_3555621 [Trichonephila clavipes]